MQLSHAGRNDKRFNAGAIVLNLQSQRILRCATLNLSRKWLAIDRAANSHIVQARMAFNDVMIFTHLDDGFAALTAKLVHMHRDIPVGTFGT